MPLIEAGFGELLYSVCTSDHAPRGLTVQFYNIGSLMFPRGAKHGANQRRTLKEKNPRALRPRVFNTDYKR